MVDDLYEYPTESGPLFLCYDDNQTRTNDDAVVDLGRSER